MILLEVPFKDKDAAKGLGARWNADAKKWYVPDGVDAAAFAQWIPGAKVPAAKPAAPTAKVGNASQQKGVALSTLMNAIKGIIDEHSEQVWVRAEVASVSNKGGNVYLELTERDDDGELLAQTRASMWRSVSGKILANFEQITGSPLKAGIKILMLARPRFHERYGFSLDISNIDPSFTLGDLEAKLAAIRARLQAEGIYENQKALTMPVDYFRILVVAPEGAAGLGDFMREAEIIASNGLCEFDSVTAPFQGDNAAAEIARRVTQALLDAASEGVNYDAVAIIRGGGSPTDLAYLNDYTLAKTVCLAPLPVLTGIGHERDNTILDEVCCTRFDTPSKVIGGIWATIQDRAAAAAGAIETIRNRAQLLVTRAGKRTQELTNDIRTKAFAMVSAGSRKTTGHANDIRARSFDLVANAHRRTETLRQEVRTMAFSKVAEARQVAKVLISEVEVGARGRVAVGRAKMDSHRASVENRARAALNLARTNIQHQMTTVVEASGHIVRNGRNTYQALLREILAQGPQRVLNRGFAFLKDEAGKTVTRVAQVTSGQRLEVTMADGSVKVTAQR